MLVEMIDVLVLTSSFAAGSARSSVEASQAARDTGVSDEDWWEAQRPYLDEVLTGSQYPMLTRVSDAGGFEGPQDRSFEFGLQRILDGLEALIEARRDAG